MTTNTARSRFAGPRFSWWVGAGAVNDERQASARLATAQPGTRFFCAVPPVPVCKAGSACHAGDFFERIACDLVSADSPAAGEPAVRSAKHVF